MVKVRAFITCLLILLSLITVINGRSKTRKSSQNRKVSTPDTSPGARQSRTRSSSHHSADLPSGVASTGKLNRNSLRRGRNRKRKSKKRSRKNKPAGRVPDQDLNSNDIMRETMRQMFGFDHLPSRLDCQGLDCPRQATRSLSSVGPDSSLRNNTNSPEFKPTPPSFMLELYRTYSEDNDLMVLNSKSQGNTVRSFFPSPANPQYRERDLGQAIVILPVPESEPEFTSTSVFLYNITLIPGVEDLVAAEIRLDGPLADSQADIMVGVYQKRRQCENNLDCSASSNEVFTKVGKTAYLNSMSGTRWSDPDLATLAKRARQNEHVVIVRFMNGPEHEDTSSLRLRRHFERKPDLPSAFMAYDGHTSRKKRSSDGLEGILSSGSPVPIFIAYCNDPRASMEAESVPAAPIIWKALENVTSAATRVRRSASSGSGGPSVRDPPEGNAGALSPTETHTQHTRDAPKRSSVFVVEKRKKGIKRRRKNRNNFQMSRNATLSSNTIDGQNRRQSKKNRNRGKNNRRTGRRNRPRNSERVDIKLHSSVLAEVRRESCSRRSLTVSFADIGWSPWIITPENFEAYYCSGNCDLKQSEDTSATNHAIIQSVVKNIAGHSDLPSPCCVPDKLLPLSVLFFDQDKNVVLKNFPNMSVETCGCR